MNCPLCVDTTLEITFHAGVELDICPRCRGVWLDRGELERIGRDAGSAPTIPPDDRDVDRQSSRRTGDARPESAGRSKKSKKKRFADRLSDVFEEIVDL